MNLKELEDGIFFKFEDIVYYKLYNYNGNCEVIDFTSRSYILMDDSVDVEPVEVDLVVKENS